MTDRSSIDPLISAAGLAELAGDPSLLVVDVRPLPMYLAGHIPGAVSLDVGSLRLPASDESTIAAWTPMLERAWLPAKFLRCYKPIAPLLPPWTCDQKTCEIMVLSVGAGVFLPL